VGVKKDRGIAGKGKFSPNNTKKSRSRLLLRRAEKGPSTAPEKERARELVRTKASVRRLSEEGRGDQGRKRGRLLETTPRSLCKRKVKKKSR